jgi:hypothetical protein
VDRGSLQDYAGQVHMNLITHILETIKDRDRLIKLVQEYDSILRPHGWIRATEGKSAYKSNTIAKDLRDLHFKHARSDFKGSYGNEHTPEDNNFSAYPVVFNYVRADEEGDVIGEAITVGIYHPDRTFTSSIWFWRKTSFLRYSGGIHVIDDNGPVEAGHTPAELEHFLSTKQ